MKLWIIYKDGIGFSKIIAEMLQDRLEEFIDVDLGSAKRIEPTFLFEERLDYLIIGDIISKEIPSLEVQKWLLKFWEISNKKKITLKAISGFYVALAEIYVEPIWVEFLHDNVKAETIYPPLLRLKLNLSELSLENRVIELVKDYSNDFIEFLINNVKKKEKRKK